MVVHVILVASLGISLLGGCGWMTGKATRSLTEAEQRYLQHVLDRVKQNEQALTESLDTLMNLASRNMAREHSSTLSISKAKLLESMRSPWAKGSNAEQFKTQRAVALYHLYDLAESEREVVNARIKERRAAMRAVAESYGQLVSLLYEAIENEHLVLAHLDQPSSARIAGVLSAFAEEVRAFHQQLARSDNPEWRALAAQVAQAEAQVSEAKARIESSLFSSR